MTPGSRMKPPGRFSRAVRGGVRRLEGRRLLLGWIVAAVGLAMAWVAWESVNGVPLQDRYEVKVEVPASSPILKEGDAVRIAGRYAGFVDDVEPAEGNVLVSAQLRPEFAPLGADARANVKVRSIVYLTYLELIPGDVDDPLPEGGTIPVERTSSGVDLLEVVQVFDRRARSALEHTITSAGAGVAGRGEAVNATIADYEASAADLGSQTRALTARPGALARLLAGAAGVARGLRADRPDDVAALLDSGSAVAAALAARERELGEAIELLRPVEDELLATSPLADPLLADAQRTVRALEPAARRLAGALPEVNRLLALGDRIRLETARLAAAINPVLAAAAPVLRDLRPTIASIEPLLGPLDSLIAAVEPYAEDIRRAGRGIVSATDNSIPVGATAAGNPALRFTPILTCHEAREPYPEPGETMRHSEPC
jgi:phospholipid/cholesterol/gamma-HCH transport system substrate-binding protein